MVELELCLHRGGPEAAPQWKQVMCKARKGCGGMVTENLKFWMVWIATGGL